MRKLVLITMLTATAVAGCGQSRAESGGPNVQRSFQVGNFDQVEVTGPYDVQVRTGSAPSVSGNGPQQLMDELVVEVEGSRLMIHPRAKQGWFRGGSRHGTARLTVTVPTLRGASIAGSGDVSIDKIAGDRFDGAVAGSGNLTLDSLQVQALKLSIAGSGGVSARSGQARDAAYSISGSGDIDARGVSAATAALSIAGSGNINGMASDSAAVSIMGSGNVQVSGGAKCSVQKAGSGNVSCS